MADYALAHLAPDMVVYQNDTLPSFAAAVQDSNGTAIDLTDCTAAYLQIRHPDGTVDEHELTIASAASGIVTYDWTEIITGTLEPAVYAITVRCVFPDGQIIAPGDYNSRLTIRPELTDPPTEADAWLTVDGDPIYTVSGEQVFLA